MLLSADSSSAALGCVLAEGDAGVDAEAGVGGGLDVEEVGDGGGDGVAVEDSGVAEDIHQEGVGAVGGVELHPLPIFAGAGAAGGGVGFGEAAESSRPKMMAGSEPGEMSWRRFWVWARWWARALRSRRRREADQDRDWDGDWDGELV